MKCLTRSSQRATAAGRHEIADGSYEENLRNRLTLLAGRLTKVLLGRRPVSKLRRCAWPVCRRLNAIEAARPKGLSLRGKRLAPVTFSTTA